MSQQITKQPLGIRIPYRRDNFNGYYEQVTSDMEHAKTNLMMLLLTSKGERPMMPTYGSDLRHLLFSQNTESGSNIELEDAVRSAVSIWMPTIQVDDVFIFRDTIDTPDLEYRYETKNGRTRGMSSGGDSGTSPYTANITITFSLKTIPDSQQELELTIEA